MCCIQILFATPSKFQMLLQAREIVVLLPQIVVGFWEYTNGGKYVKKLSGWTSYPTFLKFKPSFLNNFNGYCVAISD